MGTNSNGFPPQISCGLVILLVAGACSTGDPRIQNQAGRERGPDGTFAYSVQVDASEPGVRIEADGDIAGTTPLTLKIFGDKDGTFHSFGRPDYTVKAYPVLPGQSVQTRVFGTGAWFGREDRIPSAIYFDMNLPGGGTGAAPIPSASETPPVIPPPSGRGVRGTGTAFAVTDDGHLISNYHVIEGASRVVAVFPDERVEARIVAKDLRNDLAILKVFKRAQPLPLGNSGSVRLGEEVGTLGFPRPESQGTKVKFGRGTVSGLAGLQDDVAQLQVSVPAQPGNSGGPLINNRGEVIGVMVSTLNPVRTLLREGSLPQNVNYAVKTAYLRLLLETVPDLVGRLPAPGIRSSRPFEELAEDASHSVVLIEAFP